MKRLLFTVFMTSLALLMKAQDITYNHDDSFKNQFTVAELGSGSLSPDLYYGLFHNSYMKEAETGSIAKQTYRTAVLMSLLQETPYAKDIDSSMVKRAEIEALNVAERTPGLADLAWTTEGSKIESKMSDIKDKIGQITSAGGSSKTRQYFENCYNCLETAVEATREAYMPLSNRKDQYLKIYKDAVQLSHKAESLLVYLRARDKTEAYRERQKMRRAQLSEIAGKAHTRWKAAMSGSSSGAGTGVSAD